MSELPDNQAALHEALTLAIANLANGGDGSAERVLANARQFYSFLKTPNDGVVGSMIAPLTAPALAPEMLGVAPLENGVAVVPAEAPAPDAVPAPAPDAAQDAAPADVTEPAPAP